MLLWQPKGNVSRAVGELAGHSAGVCQLVVADEQSQVGHVWVWACVALPTKLCLHGSKSAGKAGQGRSRPLPQSSANALLMNVCCCPALSTRAPACLPACPACLPARPLQVITLSDDQVVRVWDLRSHKCVQAIGRNGEHQAAAAA